MLAKVLVYGMALYLLAGFIFALFFVRTGVGRVDPLAKEGSRGFRILIFPGVAALWPLMLRRLRQGTDEAPREFNSHLQMARKMEHQKWGRDK
ncbi:MAG: hypothetical protein QNK37_33705 [Acidobacteriota bacterium]|nr:hypothetical protein [Acidobacteriota bacterium]